ncbi:D-2-hydroxyacid dehydrogenase [Fusobacterium mortiferum]|uniref:D-2-hydroxyacid dehydrogenase n=1 Tax=Fusobacterium mortiferum TaxID=850 RepID=UPI001F388BF4|nr:D-2-hydroxyacid dehydrogenase [Fusobacterium mortiferum]MCF2699244.1 D-2-hydroxyacid dehydrogenase [Fusobacterium mortiferum]
MAKIIITIPMTEEDKKIIAEITSLPSSDICYLHAENVTQEILENCEIILGNISPNLLQNSKNIRWIHLNSAGINSYIDILSNKDITLTNSTGAYDLALAEHALALIFALKKKIPNYIKNQQECIWKDEGKVESIFNSKTLIVGLGNIGKELGKKLYVLGSRVSGVKKNLDNYPEFIEKIYSIEDLDEILSEFDIVVSILPETSETFNLFDIEKFKKMKKNSIFINIGRGTTVSSDDLYLALENNLISGAGIDVTHIEPLPKTHNLWKSKNLILTPHIAGGYHLDYTLNNIRKLAIENLKSFLLNKPLKNIITSKKGY